MYRFLHSIVGEYTVKLSCADPLPFLRRLTLNKVLFWSLRGGDGVWYLKTTLSCGERVFEMKDVMGLAMHGKYTLVFSTPEGYFELRPSEEANVYKFFLLYQAYQKQAAAAAV